ncbi:arginase family protein [Micromonospora carbonacea]|uniref:arginase family protein n=1 Tax=Micromonospora carbonacea TaxID=47853 RepID=UPI003715CD71
MMRRIAVLDAPSNLGLRPPTPTAVPGCAKAPGALRDQGLLARLRARDAGCLTPPRYDPGDWRPGDGVCHAPEIAAYSAALADRIGAIIDRGEFPLVLGGDCSILLGSALAMHRLGEAVGGRIGLVFVDGHSDFRHPGNASYVGAAAGEDLALVTGRGQADLAAIEGRRPYFRDIDVVVLGIRAQDEYRLDLQAAGITTRPVPALRAEGAARTAQWAHEELADCAGYWVHVDVDVLDPAVMPAVDAPDAGGIAFAELEILLAGLVDTPHCLGVELTVFDPDYDVDGAYAAEIVNTVVAGLAPVTAPSAVPPRLLPAAPETRLVPAAPEPRLPPGSRPFPAPERLAPAGPDGPAADPLAAAVDPLAADLSAAAGAPTDPPAGPDRTGGGPVGPAGRVDDAGLVAGYPPGPTGTAPLLEPVGPPASAGPGLLRRVTGATPGDAPPPSEDGAPPRPAAGIA